MSDHRKSPSPKANSSTLPLAIPATKFPLGQIVITANASGRLDRRRRAAKAYAATPAAIGATCRPEDAKQNEFALKHGDRLFSAYGTGENRFWIITERDRSVTTVLMPEDY